VLGGDDTMWSCSLGRRSHRDRLDSSVSRDEGPVSVNTGSGPLLFRLKRHPITRNLPGAGPITYSGRRVLPHVDHILDTVMNVYRSPAFRAAACASQTIVSERPP
jgi:hypothetical protein